MFWGQNISNLFLRKNKIREFRMFRRVVIPATKGVPSRGFRWMPDKEYRAKVWFYFVSRVQRGTYYMFTKTWWFVTKRLKPKKGLCDTQQSGFQTNNVVEGGHLDVYRTTVYNPQSDRDNNKKDWGPGYFTLRSSQEYRQSHDPVGYKKLESFQEQLQLDYQNMSYQ